MSRFLYAWLLPAVTFGLYVSTTNLQTSVTTNFAFTVSVGPYNDEQSSFSKTAVTIDTLPAGGLSGTLTGTFDGTLANFFNIRFSKAGDFKLVASAQGFFSATSANSYTATVAQSRIELQVNPSQPDRMLPFSLSIGIYDQNNYTSTQAVKLKVTSDSGNLLGPAELNITGLGTFSYTFNEAGLKNLTVSTTDGSVSTSLIIKVQSLILKFNKQPPNPIDSLQTFDLEVGAYDNSGKTPEYTQKYNVSLSLLCYSSPCSGKSIIVSEPPDISEKGLARFKGVRITSSGQFVILATCTEFKIFGNSTDFTATNHIKSIKVYANDTEQSAFFTAKLTSSMIGEDDGPYYSTAVIRLTTSDGSIEGEDTLLRSVSKPVNTHEVYFTLSGQKKVVGTVEEVSSSPSNQITIYKSVVTLDEIIFPKKLTTRNPLRFKLSLYDKTGKNLETVNNASIQISSIPPSSIKGDALIHTYRGHAESGDITFTDGGTYHFMFAAGDSIFITEESYEVQPMDCRIGAGPISCMCILLFIGVVAPILFWHYDKTTKFFNFVKYKVLVFHPISGLFFKGPNYRRSLLCIQAFTCELLLLTVIGGIYAHFDTPTEHYDKIFENYYGRLLYKGAAAWVLAQAGIIPIYLLIFFAIERIRLVKWCLLVCGITAILCFGAIVGMTAKYCVGFSNFWTANFLIFVLFDLLFLQVIYSFVCLKLMSKTLSVELSTDHTSRKEKKKSKELNPIDSTTPENRL